MKKNLNLILIFTAFLTQSFAQSDIKETIAHKSKAMESKVIA